MSRRELYCEQAVTWRSRTFCPNSVSIAFRDINWSMSLPIQLRTMSTETQTYEIDAGYGQNERLFLMTYKHAIALFDLPESIFAGEPTLEWGQV